MKKTFLVIASLFLSFSTIAQSFTITELISLYKMSGKQFRDYVINKGFIGTSKEIKPFYSYYNNFKNQIGNVVYYNEVTKENIHAIMWKLNDPFVRNEFKEGMIKNGFKFMQTTQGDKNTTNLFYTTNDYLVCLTTKINASEKEPAFYSITLQSTK